MIVNSLNLNNMTTRRTFLKNSAITAAGLTFGPVLQTSGKPVPPSDKVRIGLIGCNGQGWSNLSAFLENPQTECVALCDIDDSVLQRRAGDVQKIRGAKPAGLYKDWRKLIDNKDIDLVIVGTPDHWHCIQMVAACEAGKDVYVEKPIGRTIEECNLMVKAAQRYKSARRRAHRQAEKGACGPCGQGKEAGKALRRRRRRGRIR